MTYLMNKNTGSVDTLENWGDDYLADANYTWEQWSRELIEVTKDGKGNLIESGVENG